MFKIVVTKTNSGDNDQHSNSVIFVEDRDSILNSTSERKEVGGSGDIQEVFDNIEKRIIIYESLDNGRDFVLKYMNKSRSYFLNSERTVFIGRKISEIFHKPELSLLNILKRVNETDKAEKFDIIIYENDKMVYWSRNKMFKLSSGDIFHFQDDITKLERAKIKAQEKERELIEIQGLSKIGSFRHKILTEEITGTPEFFKIIGFNPEFPLYLPSFYKIVPTEDLKEFKGNVKKSFNEPAEFYFRIKTSMGHEKCIKAKTSPKHSEEGAPLMVVGYVQDITRLKKYENELISALDKKDILVREIQHRVKNNLQLLLSLLNLQAQYENYSIREVVICSKSRIKSMALTHEDVYNAPDLKQNVQQYINNLTTYLFQLYKKDPKLILLEEDTDDLKLGIDTLMPLGLIINELITNSLKHAFPEETPGKIQLSLKSKKDNLILKISDNGTGIPQTINIDHTKKLGLKIVNILTTQLDGTLELTRNPGTTYKITFKEQHYTKRT